MCVAWCVKAWTNTNCTLVATLEHHLGFRTKETKDWKDAYAYMYTGGCVKVAVKCDKGVFAMFCVSVDVYANRKESCCASGLRCKARATRRL